MQNQRELSRITKTALTLLPSAPMLSVISLPLASEKHMNADLAGTGRLVEDDDDSEEPLLESRFGASLK